MPRASRCAECAVARREIAAADGAVGDDGTRRQRLQEYAPVGLGLEARIADDDDAEIVEVADQAADALLQGQHGLRQLILEEWVAAAPANALEARLEQRIIGRGKRQLVDGDDGERIALHVDALPKAAGGQQHGIAEFAKSVQQRFARRLALHQHRKRRLRESAPCNARTPSAKPR